MNNGSTGKHTVILHLKDSETEKQKVWIYDFLTPEEAIEFFDSEFFNCIHKGVVSVFYLRPDGTVIFDKTTEVASKTTQDSLEYLGDEDPLANPPEMYETMREAALDGLDEFEPKETNRE